MPKTKPKKDKKRKDRKNTSVDGPSLAAQADRYELYLASVQEPEHEVEFFQRAYADAFGKKARPHLLREDFCGTAAVCYEWVKARKKHEAIGVDIDSEPVEWGKANLTGKLRPEQLDRVELRIEDARDVHERKADVLAAQNFSFWYFKTRPELLRYLKAAYANLGKRGIMVLDMMGGPESMTENEEDRRKIKIGKRKFTYIWEQARVDPITHHCSYYISFEFPDRSELHHAFEYHWRFWMIPEVRELLEDAGFTRSVVYWEGTDEDGDGNGEYEIRDNVPNDPSWVSYIVAIKE